MAARSARAARPDRSAPAIRGIAPGVVAVVVCASVVAFPRHAHAAASVDAVDVDATPARGPLFAPDGPGRGRLRLGLGILFDAVDPQALAGLHLSIPQITVDARFEPGGGVALLAHLNTILASNQVELGAGWSLRGRRVSGQVRVFGGALIGSLNRFGFEAFTVTPLIRPGVVAGGVLADHRLSLAVDVLVTPMQLVRLGGLTVEVRSASAFTGMSATATVEVMLDGGGVVFYGAALMWTRANYQAWLLFSDEPNLLAYPRVFAGYGF